MERFSWKGPLLLLNMFLFRIGKLSHEFCWWYVITVDPYNFAPTVQQMAVNISYLNFASVKVVTKLSHLLIELVTRQNYRFSMNMMKDPFEVESVSGGSSPDVVRDDV